MQGIPCIFIMDRKPSVCHKLSLLEKYCYYYSQCNLTSFVCKFKESRMPNCKERLGLLAHGKSCDVVLCI